MSSQSPSHRTPTSSPALLVCKDGTEIACLVLNLSAGGAKLEIEIEGDLPDAFHLTADDLNIKSDAQLVWRVGSKIGVRFASRQRVVGAAPESRRRTSQQPIGLGDITTAR